MNLSIENRAAQPANTPARFATSAVRANKPDSIHFGNQQAQQQQPPGSTQPSLLAPLVTLLAQLLSIKPAAASEPDKTSIKPGIDLKELHIVPDSPGQYLALELGALQRQLTKEHYTNLTISPEVEKWLDQQMKDINTLEEVDSLMAKIRKLIFSLPQAEALQPSEAHTDKAVTQCGIRLAIEDGQLVASGSWHLVSD